MIKNKDHKIWKLQNKLAELKSVRREEIESLKLFLNEGEDADVNS